MYFSRLRVGFLAVLTPFLLIQTAAAQNVKMPSSLRYGTGLLDIPVASVLPHLAITGTYSGFGITIDQTLEYDRNGDPLGRGTGYDKWLSDGSLAIGLFNRLELGATVQHYDSVSHGGKIVGGFGRISLLPASLEGFDLAVGARYLSSPTYDSPYLDDLQPGRFGYPDYRLTTNPRNAEEFNTNLTPYAVGTAYLPISEASFVSLTLGWGGGMFSAGSDLDFYQDGSTGGVFGGTALHVGLGTGRQLNLMAEHNGFDANAGLQIDLGGIRVGAFALGFLYDNFSTFRSKKFGILGSIAFCGARGGLCGAPGQPAAPPPPPPARDPGPTAAELEAMRQDSIRRAQAEEEARLRREAEAAERERQRAAMEARNTLENMVFFDYDEAAIRTDAEGVLRAKLDILRDNPTVQLRLEGHADERGRSEYNLALANARAEAVRGFFVNFGLDPARFSVVTYGEEQPQAQGSTEQAWARNRRVEFVITAGGDDIGR